MKNLKKSLLILVLICTILTAFGSTVLAQEEKLFGFKYDDNRVNNYSDDITMTETPPFDNDGWIISPNNVATIAAKREGITITRIEAFASRNQYFSFDMNVSSGTVEETDSRGDGWIIINNINSDSVTIGTNNFTIQFLNFHVYYTDDGSQSPGSAISQGNITIIVGVVAVSVIVLGGVLLSRKKKKPASANGVSMDHIKEEDE